MTGTIPSAGLVAGGYLLTHRGDTPDVDGYLSASECVTCQFPGYWALSWTDVDIEERRALLAHWGADPARLPEIVAAATDAFESGTLAWPAVFTSLKAARRFARRNPVGHPTLTLVGIALPSACVGDFLGDGEDDGFTEAVARGGALAPGADAGWEILADDGGSFHSWHCHPDVEADVAHRHGIAAGPEGLLADRSDAEQVAAVYESDPGTEDVRWLPWLVRRYSI